MEDAREEGEYIDGFDDDRPDLNQFERWLIARFRELDRSRQQGMSGVAALTVAEIEAHWRGLELAAIYPFADHLFWMQLIDGEVRAFHAEKAEKENQAESH